jgi:hypothetical protein
MGGGEDDRVANEAILMAFDCSDHRGLGFRRLVVMNHTDASQELPQEILSVPVPFIQSEDDIPPLRWPFRLQSRCPWDWT